MYVTYTHIIYAYIYAQHITYVHIMFYIYVQYTHILTMRNLCNIIII